jgi:hypothetical protein
MVLAVLTLTAVSRSAHAATLDVYVYTNTWAIQSVSGSGAWAATGGIDAVASSLNQYGQTVYRYYTYGYFSAVNIYNESDDSYITTLGSCNNIFYIDRVAKAAYTLSNGYNGSGNGVNGEIYKHAAFGNGDFYIGGAFTIAGGYSNASHFSCYRWSSGWSGVNGVRANGAVDTMYYNGYDLVIQGAFTTVYGPAYSGGPIVNISAGNTATWDNWNRDFSAAFWK